ncbi:ras association domain-containing protein 8-like [Antennarius striatus]|uniref:ras association domain-containing protein 8-like n=1 Tax=Antennarius striatus TaxID=241820 RepID=UPI0035B2D8B8
MEVKVTVDGIPRVVCGVTEETTCQEVVIALAQALGQPGRYTLRETFKDFERCMTPNECLLETLDKYGEQAREVKFTLLHNGPSVWEEMSRTKVGRYQPCPPLRRKDVGRARRGSCSLTLHRRSMPPLSSLRQDAEQQRENLKRPKRKSLTLMEEAWEWLENLGKSKVYSTANEGEINKRIDRKNRFSWDFSLTLDSGQSSKSKVKGQKSLKSDLDHQTSCCMGSQTRAKVSKHSKQSQEAKSDGLYISSCATTEEEKNSLGETIIHQLSCLHDLQVQIAQLDNKISELEEKQKARKAEQEAQQRMTEEEMEQIKFWENELKAEEVYERDLQDQFLEMKAKAAECKPKLEEYKRKIQGLDFFAAHVEEDSKMDSKTDAHAATATGNSVIPTKELKWQQSHPEDDVNINRKLQPREELNSPHAPLSSSLIRERRPTGPTELREWWTRWSESQSSQSQTKKKVIHRSELTIYLGSTKV